MTSGTSAGGGDGSDALVSARGVTKRYGDRAAVADLSLDVAAGTIFGFIGPSGSGKTTTVRLLTGGTAPTSGEVRVLGRSPTSFSTAERTRIGYMPQLGVLYPSLSIQENLQFVASIYGMPLRRAVRERRLSAALSLVELREDRRTLLRNASGGMQRRVALAAALLHEPELLFLDEPTAGIDPVLRRRFWDHFAELKGRGRTLLVTTQYVGEAAYCDLVAVLAEGRLLTVDTPEGLRRQAFGGELVDIVAAGRIDDAAHDGLRALDGVLDVTRVGTDRRALRVLVPDAGTALPRLQRELDARGVPIESAEPHVPPFDDVFVALVEGLSGRRDGGDDRGRDGGRAG